MLGPFTFQPLLALNINRSLFPAMQVAYKRRELKNNGRYDELKALMMLYWKRENEEIRNKQKSKLSKQASIVMLIIKKK